MFFPFRFESKKQAPTFAMPNFRNMLRFYVDRGTPGLKDVKRMGVLIIKFVLPQQSDMASHICE